jgi:DNA-binding transcriptional LysR family regulator
MTRSHSGSPEAVTRCRWEPRERRHSGCTHEGRLVALLSEYQVDEPEPVYAVFQSRRNLSLRVKVFLKFLETRLSQRLPVRPT